MLSNAIGTSLLRPIINRIVARSHKKHNSNSCIEKKGTSLSLAPFSSRNLDKKPSKAKQYVRLKIDYERAACDEKKNERISKKTALITSR